MKTRRTYLGIGGDSVIKLFLLQESVTLRFELQKRQKQMHDKITNRRAIAAHTGELTSAAVLIFVDYFCGMKRVKKKKKRIESVEFGGW